MVYPSRFLLDTRVLLWSLASPDELHPSAFHVIRDPYNQIYVSAASVWEMAIKSSLGKLKIPGDLEDQLRINRFDHLSVTIAHAVALQQLPILHRDPFDRMLVAQARHEGVTLITRDLQIQQYDVPWITA